MKMLVMMQGLILCLTMEFDLWRMRVGSCNHAEKRKYMS
jgi:hypothetical protein